MAREMHGDVWKIDSEWFRPWFNSEAYRLLYGNRNEGEASDLVTALLHSGALGQPGIVLDAGCGNGRHARAFARAGWEVEAFDLSVTSIHNAQSLEASGSLHYRVLDLRELIGVEEWHEKFDVVTNFFTSLGYFQEEADQANVISGFNKSLKCGGSLLIDYLNVDWVKDKLVAHEFIHKEGVTFEIHRRIHQGWIEKSIQFEWHGESNHFVERVQALNLADFERLLGAEGLTIQRVWGDYKLSVYSASSPRLMLLAQKTSTLLAES